jgi:hypothetical protein
MTEPFIFINTYGIQEGKADEYRRGAAQVIDLVREAQPQILYFGFFVNDEGTEATTIQVHPNPESMLSHMDLAARHIESSSDTLDFSKMEITVLGTPTEAVLDRMRQLPGTGVPVRIEGLMASVSRLTSVTA